VAAKPDWISMQLGVYIVTIIRVMGIMTRANPCGATTACVVWVNATCHIFGFVVGLYLFTLSLGSSQSRTKGKGFSCSLPSVGPGADPSRCTGSQAGLIAPWQ